MASFASSAAPRRGALRRLLSRPGVHAVLAAALLAVHLAYYYGWSLDDPYISYRYAQNLAGGKGLAFNEGERVEGYSNFTYVAILAAAAVCRLDLPNFSRAFGFLCSLATLLLVWLGLRGSEREDEGGIVSPLVHRSGLYLLAFNGPFAMWGVGGLETGFYTLLGTAALLRCAREMEGGARRPWSALLGALAAMSRPEGILVFAVCLIAKIIWIRQGRGTETRARAALWAGGFFVLFGLYNAWRVSYFGDWLPNTYYAKATASLSERLRAGGLYAAKGLLFTGGPLALVALVLGAWTAARGAALGLLAAGFCAAQLLFLLWAGGDWMRGGRFIAPAVPALAWLANDALVWLWRRAGRDKAGFWRGAVAAGAGLCMAASLRYEYGQTSAGMWLYRNGALYQQYVEAGKWLAAHSRPGDRLASIEAGIVPYYSKLPFIDLGGLVDKHIARREGALHHKVDTAYVLSLNPRFVFMQCQSLDPPKAFYPNGPDEALLADPEFHENYTVRKSWPRGLAPYGPNPMVLFERKRDSD